MDLAHVMLIVVSVHLSIVTATVLGFGLQKTRKRTTQLSANASLISKQEHKNC